MARAPKKKPLPVAPGGEAPPVIENGISFEIAEQDGQIENGDGMLIVNAGDYVVQTEGGVSVMPAANFFAAFPEMALA